MLGSCRRSASAAANLVSAAATVAASRKVGTSWPRPWPPFRAGLRTATMAGEIGSPVSEARLRALPACECA